MFTREAPNRLWVTDITEHRTYEGIGYCAVVLDTRRRKWMSSTVSHQMPAMISRRYSGRLSGAWYAR